MEMEPGGPVCMNREIANDYKFMEFCFRARFYHDHNLKLAYLLIKVKNCSLVEAAAALKISRTLFYTKIFPDNSAFLSKTVPIAGWGTGRSERRIKMTDETLAYSEQIQGFAEFSLGAVECQGLKAAGKKIMEGEIKRNAKYQTRIETLRKNSHKAGHMRHIMTCAKDFCRTKERVLKDVEGGQ